MIDIYKDHNKWVATVKKLGVINYAEDIVQDAYIKAYELPGMNSRYFYRILFNMAMDSHRSKRKMVKLKDVENIAEFIDVNPDVSDILIFMDSWDWFDKMFYLRYIEDKTSLRKFAKKYDYNYSWVFRTLKRLNLKLQKHGKGREQD